jgi:hypothetical protein
MHPSAVSAAPHILARGDDRTAYFADAARGMGFVVVPLAAFVIRVLVLLLRGRA